MTALFFRRKRPEPSLVMTIILVSISVALNAGLWVGAWVLSQHSREITPLHYTIYFGIDLTAPAHWLFAVPAFGLLSIISHLVFARLSSHPIWARSWQVVALTLQVLLGAVLAVLAFLQQSV